MVSVSSTRMIAIFLLGLAISVVGLPAPVLVVEPSFVDPDYPYYGEVIIQGGYTPHRTVKAVREKVLQPSFRDRDIEHVPRQVPSLPYESWADSPSSTAKNLGGTQK